LLHLYQQMLLPLLQVPLLLQPHMIHLMIDT
jgi:hypothetical protein